MASSFLLYDTVLYYESEVISYSLILKLIFMQDSTSWEVRLSKISEAVI